MKVNSVLKKNILIQEDDFRLASTWESEFIKLGHVVTIVQNATEAKFAISKCKFHLIIVDLLYKHEGRFTPDGGLITIGHLRAKWNDKSQQWYKHVPVIAVSTESPDWANVVSPLKMAENFGANLIFNKPFSAAELVKVARPFLEQN